MFQQEQQLIEDKIKVYSSAADIPLAELKWQPIPFSGEWGVSTSFFQTAANEARAGRGSKVPVPQRAQEIAEQVKAEIGNVPGISRVEAVKGYLNLYFETAEYARRVVDEVLSSQENFGRGAPKRERVMVEYAQPNTHHSFHIGHARNTILGEVLARLVDFAGFETIRATYPGDMGLSVMTAVWAYEKFYKGQEPEGIHERGRWQVKIYAEATAKLEPKENETPEEKARRETYDAERREMLRKWESDDPYVHEVWRLTREWSLEEFRDILRILDVKMDVWFYESEANKLGKEIVDELIAKGIADDERPTGPVIVKIDEKLGLTKEKYRTMVILRSDGTSLYSTKDLALAKQKFETYHVDRSIYVVDFRQSLHFQQVFKILELWGFPQAAKCYHLSYGYVTLPEGAMSSRRGRVILFKDVYDEAVKRALSVESEKTGNIAESERGQIAEQIGLGALVYSMLAVDNNKDIVFDLNEALSFDGRTGPYIQNAHVRANSILKKAEVEAGNLPDNFPPSTFHHGLTKHEIELIEQISRFPNAVQQAANEYRPLVMAAYAYDLANAFHSFYHAVPVLQSGQETIKNARLRLVAAAKQTLANALRLLDIKAPEVM